MPQLSCPLCDQAIEQTLESFRSHVYVFHGPPSSLDYFERWAELSQHLWQVAHGLEPLSSRLEGLRGPGSYTRHAALLAKSRAKLVLNTPVSTGKVPPSNITYATPRKPKK